MYAIIARVCVSSERERFSSFNSPVFVDERREDRFILIGSVCLDAAPAARGSHASRCARARARMQFRGEKESEPKPYGSYTRI